MPQVENRCVYQEVNEFGSSIVSIKQDTLAFHHGGLEQLRFYPDLTQTHVRPSEDVTVSTLREICKKCDLCLPDIQQTRNGIRIVRHDYKPKSLEIAPFYIVEHYPKESRGVGDGRVVVVVDDSKLQANGLADYLSSQGFDCFAYSVDPNRSIPETVEKQLATEISHKRPMWVVSDKGLGYADGIALLRSLRSQGFGTVMTTGEPDTRETHRVAHHFLEKPYDLDELLGILTTYPRESKTDNYEDGFSVY